MQPNVQNLILVELGPELVAEADFQEHRISVRCIYDVERRRWAYHVFLVDGTGMNRISDYPTQLHSSSRIGVVYRGMRFARNTILKIEQPVLLVVDEFKLWDKWEEGDG